MYVLQKIKDQNEKKKKKNELKCSKFHKIKKI
jgi:hypothetical protein